MIGAVAIFQSVSLILALLAAAILTFVNRERSLPKVILSVLLVVLGLLELNGILFASGWYLHNPGWHKVLLPLSLLIAPASYLYIRTTLRGEYRLRPTDVLLALPAVLYALNLIPYFSLPPGEKRSWVEQYYRFSSLRSSDQEGWLPAYIPALFRAFWSMALLLLSTRLIKQYTRTTDPDTILKNSGFMAWIKQLNAMMAVLITFALVVALIAPVFLTVFNLPNFALGLTVFVISLNLFLRPRILYGIHQPVKEPAVPVVPAQVTVAVSETEAAKALPSASDPVISPSEAARLKRILETHFELNRPYLDCDYSLEKLVRDTGTPRYVLSAFINREYGMGFRELLNRYRVAHYQANVGQPEWENYTLEAIARECGFGNRVTFFRNFKLVTGHSPTHHLRKGSADEAQPLS
jgi:AraC-like DNA-binding protein